MNENYFKLTGSLPRKGEFAINWDGIIGKALGLSPYFEKMRETMQNRAWHGEGDVLTHTKMVCERLINLEAWQTLPRFEQNALFAAALLHDIGKTVSTKEENGILVSPNHSAAGERIVRTVLWGELGLCGGKEVQHFRETVCALIKRHSIPFHFYNNKKPEFTVIKSASVGELIPAFTNELLSILAEADILGRIADDTESRLQHLYYFRETAKEAGCFEKPLNFPSAYSRHAYLSGKDIYPGQELYDSTWGTVIMMAGLPGTGKDTYINENLPDMPVVSLDTIRREMHVAPSEPQGRVITAARELARGYLRKKQPFVWNATNLSPTIRSKQIELFESYGAAVRIIFLETDWLEMLKRNNDRIETVPEGVIAGMLERLSPPDNSEAQEVDWVQT